MVLRKLLFCFLLLATSLAQPVSILPLAHADGILVLAAGSGSSGVYDAETDIGLVANDATQGTAEDNTEKLSDALQAQWRGGSFTFVNGTTGPVLKPIVCQAKQFFFYGPIKTSNRVGGALFGTGRPGYHLPEDQYTTGGSTYGGLNTRFTRIDGENGGGVIRLRGTGFVLVGIDIKGQRYLTNVSTSGTRSDACIEIEGRDDPASGNHIISNCALGFAECGVLAIAGYYNDDDEFVEMPVSGGQQGRGVHADETLVDSCTFAAVDKCIRSENEQAVNWSFRDLTVGGSTAFEPIVFDADKGGKWTHTGTLGLNHPKVTVLRIGSYSGYYNRYDIGTISWDHFSGSGHYCRLTDVALAAGDWSSYEGLHIRMYGSLSRYSGDWDSDPGDQKLFRFTSGITNLNCSKMLYDFNNGMPTANMTQSSGPWYYPTTAWIPSP